MATMPKHNHPGWGWAGVAVFITAIDITGKSTMSEVFRAASRHRIGGPLIAIGWCYLTAHLFGGLSPRWDLFHRLGCHRKCPHVRELSLCLLNCPSRNFAGAVTDLMTCA